MRYREGRPRECSFCKTLTLFELNVRGKYVACCPDCGEQPKRRKGA